MLEIPDYPNYLISKNGKIYNKKTDREISCWKGSDGYLRFNCSNNNVHKKLILHRVLALLFIPNPSNKLLVEHIDKNKLNNNLENLRWVSRSENNINKGIFKNNKSGFKGISYRKTQTGLEYWNCQIKKNNEKHHRLFPYNFKGLVRAIVWRLKKEIELHN